MKKLSSLIAFLGFVLSMIGLAVAVISYLDRKCGLFCDESCDDLPYGGQEYYAEDLSFDPQVVEQPPQDNIETEIPAEDTQAEPEEKAQ